MQIVRCSLKVSVKPFQRLADLQGSALQQVWAAAQYSVHTRKCTFQVRLQYLQTSRALPKSAIFRVKSSKAKKAPTFA